MVQAPTPDDPTLRVRLVGDAIRQQIGRNIVGQDYFEFMGFERRAAAIDIVNAMFSGPSGVWWVAPVHYERGFSRFWEMTAFPLTGDDGSPNVVLALVKPADIPLDSLQTGEKAIRVGLAVQFRQLEIDR